MYTLFKSKIKQKIPAYEQFMCMTGSPHTSVLFLSTSLKVILIQKTKKNWMGLRKK